MTESPPNPQIKALTGKVKKLIGVEEMVFSPLVYSKSPKDSPCPNEMLPNNLPKTKVNGAKMFKRARISVRT